MRYLNQKAIETGKALWMGAVSALLTIPIYANANNIDPRGVHNKAFSSSGPGDYYPLDPQIYKETPEPGWVYAKSANWVSQGYGTSYRDISKVVGAPHNIKSFLTSASAGLGGVIAAHFTDCHMTDQGNEIDLRIGEYNWGEQFEIQISFISDPEQPYSLGKFRRINEEKNEVEIDLDKYSFDDPRGIRFTVTDRIASHDFVKTVWIRDDAKFNKKLHAPFGRKGADVDYLALRACAFSNINMDRQFAMVSKKRFIK